VLHSKSWCGVVVVVVQDFFLATEVLATGAVFLYGSLEWFNVDATDGSTLARIRIFLSGLSSIGPDLLLVFSKIATLFLSFS